MAPVPASAAGRAAGYAKIVLGMANGIVGGAILLKCRLGASQPSIYAYFLGSVTYIAAEILGGETKGGDVKANAQYMDNLKANMKEGGDYQRAAIEIQIKNEKDNLKHIEDKKIWMGATLGVYSAATIAAVLEFIWQFPPPPAGIGIGKPDFGGCSPDGVSHIPIQKGIAMAYTAANGYATGGLMGAGINVFMPYLLELMGLVSIGTAVTDSAVSMLNSSTTRIAFFAAASLLVGVILNELSNQADRSRQIIRDLEKVKGSFEAPDNGIQEGTSTSGAADLANSGNGGPQNTYAIPPLPPGTELPKHCFSTAGNVAEYSQNACASPVKITRPVFHGNFDMPTLTSATNSAADMGQAIANGDTGRAKVEAKNLSALSGRLDAMKKEMINKVDGILKGQGKKPIDIDGELKRQIAAINTEMNKKNPGSGNLAFEDLNAPMPTLNDKSLVASVATAIPSGSEKPAAEALKISEGDLVSDKNANGANELSGNNSNLSDLSQKPRSGNEINSDPDVSLFKQVSMRYFLNYDKLFNRKKVDPPLLPAEDSPSVSE